MLKESHSRRLFKLEGIVWLCSGVAMITPSPSVILLLNSWIMADSVWSSVSLNIGTSVISKISMSAFLAKCLAMYCNSSRLYDFLALVPTIATNFITCHLLFGFPSKCSFAVCVCLANDLITNLNK